MIKNNNRDLDFGEGKYIFQFFQKFKNPIFSESTKKLII